MAELFLLLLTVYIVSKIVAWAIVYAVKVRRVTQYKKGIGTH